MNHFKNLKIENRLFFFENKDQRVPQDQVNEGCLRRVLLKITVAIVVVTSPLKLVTALSS